MKFLFIFKPFIIKIIMESHYFKHNINTKIPFYSFFTHVVSKYNGICSTQVYMVLLKVTWSMLP